MDDMQEEFYKIKALPAIKIAVTGSGRVAGGALEVLDKMGLRQVSVHDYLHRDFRMPVYAQLRSADYHRRRDGRAWDTAHFHEHPAEYDSDFARFFAPHRLAHCLRLLAPGRAPAIYGGRHAGA